MGKKKAKDKKDPNKQQTGRVVVKNRKAKFDYQFLETFEAGLVLTGSEIKSIRQGSVTLAESYVRSFPDGLYLVGCNITQYKTSTQWGTYDPVRPRKLLLHKKQIDKLKGQVATKGLTLVPLDIHFTRGFAKVSIALAKGKAAPDKRRTIRERDVARDIQRKMKYGK